MIDKSPEHDNPYIIFASDKSEDDTIAYLRKFNVGFKLLSGRYKGEDEVSYIVNKQDKLVLAPLIANQESILELSKIHGKGPRTAVLRYKNGDATILGRFVPVPMAEAVFSDAYTYDIAAGVYYVCKTGVAKA